MPSRHTETTNIVFHICAVASGSFCMNRRQKEICVGVVGANKNAGWAKMSHVPAIKSLPGLKLAAVATRNEQCTGSGPSVRCGSLV